MTNPQPQMIPTTDVFPIEEEDVDRYLKKIKKPETTIVFFGSDSWSLPDLQALEESFEVTAVVTASNSPVADYFKGPILTPNKFDSDFIANHLSLLTCDLFVVASYGKIIPPELLEIPKYGSLNVHPSLLPRYRGPSPVPATILNGDKETGVTIIKMDAEIDHGSIITTRKISLSGQEDFITLINKLFQLGAKLLVEIIPDFIKGKVKLRQQDHKKAVYCERMTKEDGYFEINTPPSPDQLDRMIRAYNPWPGVWTRWNGKIVKFLPKSVTLSETKGITKKELYSSPTAQNDSRFLIQMESKKILSLKDFLNGYPDFPLKSI